MNLTGVLTNETFFTQLEQVYFQVYFIIISSNKYMNQCFNKKSQQTRYLETFQPVKRLMYSVLSQLYSNLQRGF